MFNNNKKTHPFPKPKKKLITNVDEMVWSKFSGYAKLVGMRQADFLERLIKLFEKYELNFNEGDGYDNQC